MNERPLFVFLVLGAAMLAGCAATTSDVRVQKADVDLQMCRTFDWLPVSNGVASFTEQRLRAEVLRQLEAKGYTQASEAPDCRVTYVLSANERAKRKPSVGVGVGGGSGGIGGGIGVGIPVGKTAEYEAEFTIDVVDAAKKAQIWSGSVDAALAAPEPTPEEASDLVRVVLDKFPDAKKSEKTPSP